jgi:hypothetical protein
MYTIHTRAYGQPSLGLSPALVILICALVIFVSASMAFAPVLAHAAAAHAAGTRGSSATARTATPGALTLAVVTPAGEGAGSLESAATKAGETGRKVAMSLIALGFAIASIVLAFRRDFKEAAGIFAIGLVAILLATPAGVNVLHDTVNSLFGAS